MIFNIFSYSLGPIRQVINMMWHLRREVQGSTPTLDVIGEDSWIWGNFSCGLLLSVECTECYDASKPLIY